MKKLKNKSLKVKAADVEINKEPLDSVNGNFVLKSILTNEVEDSSINMNSKYVELYEGIVHTNHFLLMLQFAFNEHKPISISPDDIWLLICQGFSNHMKFNSDDFKGVLGVEEKQTITVRNDSFVIGKDNPWEDIFPEFTGKIKQNIKNDLYSNIVLEFSTSTKKEINAFEISFIDSMSNYFNYEFVSLCGIPEIEIKGTVADYNKMLNALNELREYNLEWWIDKISDHIKKIIQTLEGENCKDFWNSIYKENNESGGPYITGWIADFFPYTKTLISESNGKINYEQLDLYKEEDILKTIQIEEFSDGYKIHRVIVKNPKLIDFSYSKLKLDDFPSGLSSVPFKWQYIGNELEMNITSGFIGIRESKENNTLETDINWVVHRK